MMAVMLLACAMCKASRTSRSRRVGRPPEGSGGLREGCAGCHIAKTQLGSVHKRNRHSSGICMLWRKQLAC